MLDTLNFYLTLERNTNNLKEQNLKLDDDDFKILRNEKITGQTLPKKNFKVLG